MHLLLLLQTVRREQGGILAWLPGLPIQPVIGLEDLDAIQTNFDAAVFISHIGDDLEAHPKPAEARHGIAEQAEIQDLLGAARIEDGHPGVE